MAGIRHATFEEEGYYDELVSNNSQENYTRQGISFGVGYRLFAKSGIYWGTSLYMGKYILGEDPKSGWDNNRFMNIEFFKFGKTF